VDTEEEDDNAVDEDTEGEYVDANGKL